MKTIYQIIISSSISVVVTLLLIKTPKIAIIDRSEIFRQQIISIQQATSGDNRQVLLQKMERYRDVINILNDKMAEIAKEKNLIILSKENAIGGEDITNQAKSLLIDLIAQTGSSPSKVNNNKPENNQKLDQLTSQSEDNLLGIDTNNQSGIKLNKDNFNNDKN